MTERLPPTYGRRMRELEQRLERLERGARGGGVYDAGGALVVADDVVSGQGLARPYLPVVLTPATTAAEVGTSAGAFTTLLLAPVYKQHPQLTVQAYVRCSDGATGGQLQLVDTTAGTTVVAAPVAIAPGFVGWVTLTGALPGAHLAVRTVELQALRNAGAGTVNVRYPVMAYGLES